ncbi:phosphoribosylanthranilate isomerase [Pseudomonas sp. GD03842]|uniref:phosphoribosylanthranilate isomerase n=1 Tax=unclassified Pseudomonas TaxID=196821 RepID=UPI000D337A5B|nr:MULTISPECIES: phosphoribosylanthranilate isomerase [unclassified Pseudomonas]MDH0748091.1 phosphoribosylanthranilate isomerase [Pseudomonas sp. GD03842]RAU47368.1 phosphoribosylanthranilate isomerase [Pseudomonas sp. RIT 409]RAU51957.1 phosphoribosylanthranilate isomerase [Pseudomonas sp. RIT 412]
MSAVRSKICGITCIEDALAAVDAGADAIGFVFYSRSPRAVTIEQAQAIIAQLPPFVSTVGLFVNEDRESLEALLEAVPLDLIQFHGDETPEQCEGYLRPWIKALRVQAGDDIAASCDLYHKASGILLDTYVAGVPGGTGEAFDWALIPNHLSKPIILAGGLTSANVAQAIAQVRPYAVDVSGGVERAKGLKDHDKIRAFMSAVHGA